MKKVLQRKEFLSNVTHNSDSISADVTWRDLELRTTNCKFLQFGLKVEHGKETFCLNGSIGKPWLFGGAVTNDNDIVNYLDKIINVCSEMKSVIETEYLKYCSYDLVSSRKVLNIKDLKEDDIRWEPEHNIFFDDIDFEDEENMRKVAVHSEPNGKGELLFPFIIQWGGKAVYIKNVGS